MPFWVRLPLPNLGARDHGRLAFAPRGSASRACDHLVPASAPTEHTIVWQSTRRPPKTPLNASPRRTIVQLAPRSSTRSATPVLDHPLLFGDPTPTGGEQHHLCLPVVVNTGRYPVMCI